MTAVPITRTVDTIPRRAALVGLMLVVAVGGAAFAGATALLARIALSPWMLVCALGAAIAVGVAWCGSLRQTAAAAGVAIAIGTGATGLASSVFDLSFDGQTYHQTAIRQLAGGWNPVWEPRAVESLPTGVHVFSLPKAAWIVHAMTFQATSSLESAKGLQAIALVAAALLGFAALNMLGVPHRVALFIAVCCAAGPVAIPQLLTFYVDGLVSSFVIIVVALVVIYFETRSTAVAIGLALAVSFLANLKFTGAVYAALIGGGALLIAVRHSRIGTGRAVGIVAITGVLSAIQGINPYATNTAIHGHPAYPFSGRDAMPVGQTVYRDSVFLAASGPTRLVRSLFGRSSDDDAMAPHPKWPFSIHPGELAAFTTVDTRVGGWGPLFGGALLLSWALVGLAIWRGERKARMLALCSLAALLSALAVPFGSYARYAPQVWLACIPSLLLDNIGSWRTRILAVVIVLNLVFVGGISLGSQILQDHLHRRQLRTLADAAGGRAVSVMRGEPTFTNVDLHFDDYRIATEPRATLECTEPATLIRTYVRVCLAEGRSPPAAPDPVASIAPLLRAAGLEGYHP